MANSPLLKKIGVKPGHRLLVLNAPYGYLDQLTPLPEKAELATKGKGPFDVVQLFVKNKAQVDRDAAKAMQAVKPRGLLWDCLPEEKFEDRDRYQSRRRLGDDEESRLGRGGHRRHR